MLLACKGQTHTGQDKYDGDVPDVDAGSIADSGSGVDPTDAGRDAGRMDSGSDASADFDADTRDAVADEDTGTEEAPVAAPDWMSPVDVLVDDERGRALVLDPGTDSIIALDLGNGTRTVVSAPELGVGSGPALDRGALFTMNASGQLSARASTPPRSLVSIDPTSGDRVATGRYTDGVSSLASDPNEEVTYQASVWDATGYRLIRAFGPDVSGFIEIAGCPESHSRLGIPCFGSRRPYGRNFSAPHFVAIAPDYGVTDSVLGPGARMLAVATGERDRVGVYAFTTLAHGPVHEWFYTWFRDPEPEPIPSTPYAGEIVKLSACNEGDGVCQPPATGTGPRLYHPAELLSDAASSVVVLDRARPGLVRVDLTTLERTLISGCDEARGDSGCGGSLVGSGPVLTHVHDMAAWPAGGRAYVLDGATHAELAVVSIDLTTGAREIVTGRGGGTGPALSDSGPGGADTVEHAQIALDVDGLHAFVVGAADEETWRAVAVSLVDGTRSVFDVSGPALCEQKAPVEAIVDPSLERILVSCDNGDGIPRMEAIALSDGSRSEADEAIGAHSMAWNATDDYLIAMRHTSEVTGMEGVGFSCSFYYPDEYVEHNEDPFDRWGNNFRVFGMAWAPGLDSVVASSEEGRLYQVPIKTGGEATLLSECSVEPCGQPVAPDGGGVVLQQPFDVAADPTRGRVLLVDGGIKALIELDLETRVRAVVTDGFEHPTGLAVDVEHDRALVADPLAGAVYAIDLATGDRTSL